MPRNILPNDASIALHLKFGFEPLFVLSEVGRKFDRYYDVQWFEKKFWIWVVNHRHKANSVTNLCAELTFVDYLAKKDNCRAGDFASAHAIEAPPMRRALIILLYCGRGEIGRHARFRF